MWRGNNHGKSQMILTEYKLDHKTNKSRSVYLLRHNSRVRNTVLEQNLTVEMDNCGDSSQQFRLMIFLVV